MNCFFSTRHSAAIFLVIATLGFGIILYLWHNKTIVSHHSSIVDTLAISYFDQPQMVTETELQSLAVNIGEIQQQLSHFILDSISDLYSKARKILNLLPESEAIGNQMKTLNNEYQNKVIELAKVLYPEVFNNLDIVGNRAIYFSRTNSEFNRAYRKINKALSGSSITESTKRGY